MKINHIGVRNYQRLTAVNIALKATILLLAGENEQGKTSLADAIYHATTGTARRVALKKDFKDLVHDGEKSGVVSVGIALPDGPDGEHGDGSYLVTVPQDKRSLQDVDDNALLPYLLDAKLFPRLKPEERRAMLFGITGKKITGKTILEKLRAKGANADKATTIGAVLLGGFAAGQEEAKSRASESRGAWKATTGETYGSKKAEEWKASKPEVDEEQILKLQQQVEHAKGTINTSNIALGEFTAMRSAIANQQQRRSALVPLVDEIPRREAKLKADKALLDEWTAKVEDSERKAGTGKAVEALACPHCSGMVELHAGKLVEHDPSKKGDPQAIALLPMQKETLAKVTRAHLNATNHLREATDAKAALAELDAHPAPDVDEATASTTQAALAAAQGTVRQLEATLSGLLKDKQAADRADADTTKAAGFHKDAIEWDEIAGWLAPSGIQSELLTEALKPFNDRLAATSVITGWDTTAIDGDMTIRVAGRAYSLCSASARWRAEAAITEAMAFISGLRILMLDEVEILVGPNRIAFLKWMHHLAVADEVDTAIIIGSFKEAPKCPPTFQVEWVAAGKAGQPEDEAVAA